MMDDPEWQLQIGTSKWPSYPVRGLAESYYRLRQSMATQGSHMHSYNTSMSAFRTHSYNIGIDTEKEASAAWTGENMRSGQQVHMMCRKFGGTSPLTGNNVAHQIKAYLHMCAEVMLVLSDAGVSLVE